MNLSEAAGSQPAGRSARAPAGPTYWSGRRVSVTGGQGFLGRHVVALLQESGADVKVVSRRTGCDLKLFAQARVFFDLNRPELIFSCASNQGGIGYQELYPGTIYYDNLLMGANTMEAARLAGVGKYVNIIAGCAYPGDPRDGILREDEVEAGPMHPTVDNYGATKRAAVMQAKCLRRQYDFQAISVILINLYGPGENFHPDRSHALAALIRKFYEAKQAQSPTVTLWGTGRAVREWLYVSDAAAECYGDIDPLNVAVGQGYTIAELAMMIKDIVGFQGEITYDFSKPDGALRKVGDTTKMQVVFTGLAANVVPWCRPWLQNCAAEPTPTVIRMLTSTRQLVRAAANSAALVQQTNAGLGLQFAPASALPGAIFCLRGVDAFQLPLGFHRPHKIVSDSTKGHLVAQNLR